MSKELDIVFMCGGHGRRMGPIAERTQKCMLLFQDKPILEHLLEQTTKAFGRFNPIFAVSHRAEDVINHFGDYWEKDKIAYIHDRGDVEDKGVLLSVEDYFKRYYR